MGQRKLLHVLQHGQIISEDQNKYEYVPMWRRVVEGKVNATTSRQAKPSQAKPSQAKP